MPPSLRKHITGNVSFFITGQPGKKTASYEATFVVIPVDGRRKKPLLSVSIKVKGHGEKALKPKWDSSTLPSDAWQASCIAENVKKLLPRKNFGVRMS